VRTRVGGRKLFIALTAACAALVLSGCGALPPGAAAVVDGTKITNGDVQELADSQCAGADLAAKTQQAQTVTRRQLSQRSLRLLMDIELSLKYGRTEGVQPRPDSAAAIYAQVDTLVKALPKQYEESTAATFHRWADATDVLVQVGERATGQKETAQNQQDLLNAGYQRRESWRKKVKVEIDPRYGPSDDGWPGAGDGSVSKASSTFAKDADAEQPNPKWVATLPASQKCG
jgi:hypothetical protein